MPQILFTSRVLFIDPDIDLSKSYDDIISFPYKNETIQQLQSQLDFRQHFRLLVEETNTVCECPEPNSKNEKILSKLKKIALKLNEKGIVNSNITTTKIGFISGNGQNPLEMVPYFKKDNNMAYKTNNYSSFMAPKNCQEYIYRIYVKNKYDVFSGKKIVDSIEEK